MASDDEGKPSPPPWRRTGGPTASIPTASRVGSAASHTAPPRPTAARSPTACSPSRSSSSSASSPPPGATGRGWPWPPSSTRTTSRSTGSGGSGCSASRRSGRHAARHTRGALPGGLLRRATRLPGGVHKAWPAMLYEQPTDEAYRRLYYYLHKLVDRAIGRILESLERRAWPRTRSSCSPPTTATWSVPTAASCRSGTTRSTRRSGCRCWSAVPALRQHPRVQMPTSHVDLVPTLLGLAGIDVERAAASVAVEHDETQPLPGRDLSPVLRGEQPADDRGRASLLHDRRRRGPRPLVLGMVSGQEYEPVPTRPMSSPSSRRCRPGTATPAAVRRRAVEAQPLLRAPRRRGRRTARSRQAAGRWGRGRVGAATT